MHYRALLVPYDFSPHAKAALYVAVDLARRLKADCHVLHVIQPFSYHYGYAYGGLPDQSALPPPDMLELRENARKSLEELTSTIPRTKIEPHVIEEWNTAAGICQMAEKLDIDLIVMGTHGRSGIAHVFLGSVAERTLRRAPCPVLTLRAPDEEESGRGSLAVVAAAVAGP